MSRAVTFSDTRRTAMRTGRPKAALVVSAKQRNELERWVRRRSTGQALALRARILLSYAEGVSGMVGEECSPGLEGRRFGMSRDRRCAL